MTLPRMAIGEPSSTAVRFNRIVEAAGAGDPEAIPELRRLRDLASGVNPALARACRAALELLDPNPAG